ncbi:MAG TPA: cell division protein FtsA [Candidatus Paceibacterota bacterium]|nr:cell division protein FtsA [Candidatus Paceibacterota bacterium]
MRSHILAIDLGTSNIKALVGKEDSGNCNVILPAHRKSRGIKKGEIVNLEETAEELDNLIAEIEGMLKNINFKRSIVGIGGPNLKTCLSKGVAVVSRPDQEITEEDKERADKAAQAFALPPNRTLVQTVSRNYIVDGVAKVKDPVGMKGLKIETECLLIDAFSPNINYIDRLGELVKLKFDPKIVLPFAGAEIALSDQDKDLGAIALDLGAGTTSACVYEDDEILDLQVFPMGGDSITNDIAVGLKTYIDIAEKIKVNEGVATKKKIGKNENIDLGVYLEEAESSERISKKFLAEIIEARLSEIFDLVADRLKEIDRFGKLPGGVVLYGGGAKMPFIAELAREKFKLPVRLANPDIEWYRENPDLSFVPVLGLLNLMSQKKNDPPLVGGILEKISNFFNKF